MTEFVRVKDPETKHEFTVTRQYAEGRKLPVIDKPALDSAGRPLTAKPHVALKSNTGGGEQSADAKNAAQKQQSGGAV